MKDAPFSVICHSGRNFILERHHSEDVPFVVVVNDSDESPAIGPKGWVYAAWFSDFKLATKRYIALIYGRHFVGSFVPTSISEIQNKTDCPHSFDGYGMRRCALCNQTFSVVPTEEEITPLSEQLKMQGEFRESVRRLADTLIAR